MSKEELLKYLIAEIDLIMHDKDYRFENANGTWYSRESCRDLTNEEVFEELRTELRQFADLETKLAESEGAYRDINRAFTEQRELCKQQLAEKEKEIATLEVMLAENKNELKELQEFKVGDDEYDLTDTDARFSLQCDLLNTEQDKISFAVEQLEKVKETFIWGKDNGYLTPENAVNIIDNQIKQLKEKQNENKI